MFVHKEPAKCPHSCPFILYSLHHIYSLLYCSNFCYFSSQAVLIQVVLSFDMNKLVQGIHFIFFSSPYFFVDFIISSITCFIFSPLMAVCFYIFAYCGLLGEDQPYKVKRIPNHVQGWYPFLALWPPPYLLFNPQL